MRRLPAKCDPTAVGESAEQTDDPLIADHRNFYKVEKWTKDGAKVSTTCSTPAKCWTRRETSSRLSRRDHNRRGR